MAEFNKPDMNQSINIFQGDHFLREVNTIIRELNAAEIEKHGPATHTLLLTAVAVIPAEGQILETETERFRVLTVKPTASPLSKRLYIQKIN